MNTDRSSIEAEYLARTQSSAALMRRASRSMTRGLTRSLSWFAPYPVVFEHGEGATLHDVDGNEYIDLFSNGLSLMHGHAYPPVTAFLRDAIGRGSAWPGTSQAQIELAELLCERIPGAERARFANTGTEATMLAVKVARAVSGRAVVIKAWHAYHGSYDDLEVGLQGKDEVADRVALARFGELESYQEALDRNAGSVAAIIVEPVQYTGIVTPPPPGFLVALRELAHEAGVLFILDDCLMFRLAEGGSAERFSVPDADITCLGKWIGGGLPVGAITSTVALLELFDPLREEPAYHGGSFNGNPLGSGAGAIAIRDLTAAQIARIDGLATDMRAAVEQAGIAAGLAVTTSGVGSAFGMYVLDEPAGAIDWETSALLHLAAVNHGVYYGSGGEFGLSTAVDRSIAQAAVDGIVAAINDVVRAQVAAHA